MSTKPNKTNALEVIAESQITTAKWQFEDLSRQIREELEFISRMESAAAVRALRFGILMHHVKAMLPHGKFMPWQVETFPGIKRSQCGYYMRLALVFIETMRLNKAEVLALPEAQLELALDKQDSSARSVLEKVSKFVGTQSLTELLIKHNIKSVGLKKELGEGAADDDDLSKLPLEDQIRIRRERVFGRTSEWLTHLRKQLTDKEAVQLLDNTQIDSIRAELADLNKTLDAVRNAA